MIGFLKFLIPYHNRDHMILYCIEFRLEDQSNAFSISYYDKHI